MRRSREIAGIAHGQAKGAGKDTRAHTGGVYRSRCRHAPANPAIELQLAPEHAVPRVGKPAELSDEALEDLKKKRLLLLDEVSGLIADKEAL